MTKNFLWITKDSTSNNLSHSSRSEEAVIRRHVSVQRKRTEILARKNRLREALTPFSLSGMQDLKPGEKRSLDYFIHRTAPGWSGWQDGAFWNGLALQASQQNVAIAHGLVAIAAWHESSSLPLKPASASRLGRLAVAQHAMALKLLCKSSDIGHSTSLISCVILASLQSHSSGEYQEYRLLKAGIAVLNEVLKSTASSADGDMASATTQISREVGPLINRLQGRLCMMADMPAALACSARYHQSQKHEPYDLPFLPFLPNTFLTLRHARECLESVLDWGRDHVRKSQHAAESSQKFHDILVGSVKQWEKVLDTIRLSRIHERRLQNLLKIAALNGIILLLTCCSPKETIFDLYNPIFSRIMTLVERISDNHGHHGRVSFGIDCGLIDILAFVGSRCRDSKIRRSALDWLQRSTLIEGERFSSETGQIVRAWISLEEREGFGESAVVSEFRRKRLLAGERYHDHHLTKLLFVSYPYDPALDATVDEVWVRTTDGMTTGCTEDMPTNTPDAIFDPAHAAFFDRKQNTFHHIHTTNFYFPIPGV